MHKYMILSAAFALGAVTVLPATQALNLGGEAQAQRGGDGQRAGNRQGRRNGQRAGNRNRNGNRSAAREPRREVTDIAPPRREARNRAEPRAPRFDRFRRWRQRDRFAHRDARRARRGFHANRFCMRPRRIRRRLHRQGWDVVAFHRAGRNFNVRAHSRRGVLHALRVDACDGHIISAHGLERKRHRGIKRAFRKIGRTFKKIF